MTPIKRTLNRLRLDRVSLTTFREDLATLRDAAREPESKGELFLDLSECREVDDAAAAALVAEVLRLRRQGVNIVVSLPVQLDALNRFISGGWAYYLAPLNSTVPRISPRSSPPMLRFETTSELTVTIKQIVEWILKSTTEFTRDGFTAVQWALFEITDNVLVHSESVVGGLIHVSDSPTDHTIQIVVADAGVGIPRTLRRAVAPVRTDGELLEQAIRERITRDPDVGQGNGLFGSFRIAEKSGGAFLLHAGSAKLELSNGALVVEQVPIPHSGTLLMATIDYTQAKLLADALHFPGIVADSDYIELTYEMAGDGVVVIDVSAEAESFTSRGSGDPVRTKILNLYRMGRDVKTISIDITNVGLISSSFADEVFGKLLLELGIDDFNRVIRIRVVDATVRQLIDRAIAQRTEDLKRRPPIS